MQNVFKNTSILFFGKLVVAACGFLTTTLLTRYLGARGYSEYAYIIALTGAFFVLADYGLSIEVIRRIAKKKIINDHINTIFVARGMLSLLSLLLLVIYSYGSGLSASLLWPLIFMSGIQIIQWHSLTYEAVLQGRQEFFRAVAPQIAVAFLSLIGMYVGMLYKAHITTLFSIMLTMHVSGLLLYRMFAGYVPSPIVSIAKVRILIFRLFPLALGTLFATLYFKIDAVILGYYFAPHIHNDVGIYSVAYKWFEIGIVFTGYFIQALFPYIAGITDHNALVATARKYTVNISVVSILMSGTLYMFAPQLVAFIAGGEFIASVGLLRILSFAFTPTLLAGFYMSLLLALKQDRLYASIGAFVLALNIVVNMLFIPTWSSYAAAYTTVITQIVAMCAFGIGLYGVLKRIPLSINPGESSYFYDTFHAVTKAASQIPTLHNYTHGPLLKMIDPYLKKKPQHILDVGCGTGALALYLASKNINITGIDISQRAINACKDFAVHTGLTKRTTFIHTTLEDFSTTQKFDMITAIEIIEHVSKPDLFLAHIRKRLKDGGVLIISTPSRYAPLLRIGFLDDFEKRVGHLRRYNTKEIVAILEQHKFLVEEVHETEGFVRNYMYTSTLGTKVLLRLINRVYAIQRFFEMLDGLSMKLVGTSDIIIIARKK